MADAWFTRYWSGERGTWTIGDAGVGHVAHNNGVESRWPKFSQAIRGSAGKSKQLKLDRRVWRRMVGTLSQIEWPHQTPPGGALITQQI